MSEQLPGSTPDDVMFEYATLYPEVARAGSLLDALKAEVDRAGCGLTVELTSSPGWRLVAAQVSDGDRSVRVLMAEGERSYSVDCWADKVHMAEGRTGDLSDVAGVCRSWLEAPGVRELVRQWPFLRTWELAEAHERGDAVPVRWRLLREAATRRRDTALHDLVEAAFAQPRLRALSPGRSMHWVTFSRRAAPPICPDLPRVMSTGDGRYRIRFADGRLREVDGAAQAVALVVEHLPADAVPSSRSVG